MLLCTCENERFWCHEWRNTCIGVQGPGIYDDVLRVAGKKQGSYQANIRGGLAGGRPKVEEVSHFQSALVNEGQSSLIQILSLICAKGAARVNHNAGSHCESLKGEYLEQNCCEGRVKRLQIVCQLIHDRSEFLLYKIRDNHWSRVKS